MTGRELHLRERDLRKCSKGSLRVRGLSYALFEERPHYNCPIPTRKPFWSLLISSKKITAFNAAEPCGMVAWIRCIRAPLQKSFRVGLISGENARFSSLEPSGPKASRRTNRSVGLKKLNLMDSFGCDILRCTSGGMGKVQWTCVIFAERRSCACATEGAADVSATNVSH